MRVTGQVRASMRFQVVRGMSGCAYSYNEVLDRAVHAYHRNGAAIEVIWSRRRVDDSEIDCLAVHFEVIRTPNGWRIAGIQRRPTKADRLAEAGTATDRTPSAR
jgi:hypothetical protein